MTRHTIVILNSDLELTSPKAPAKRLQHLNATWARHVACLALRRITTCYVTGADNTQHDGQTHATCCAKLNVVICCAGMSRSSERL